MVGASRGGGLLGARWGGGGKWRRRALCGLLRSIRPVPLRLAQLTVHSSARLGRLPAPPSAVCSRAGERLAHGRAPLTTQLAAGRQ